MLSKEWTKKLDKELEQSIANGYYKPERIISSPQSPRLKLASGEEVINLCANNYLGLANHPKIVASAKQTLDRYGFGLSSVRFICGTLDIHKQLEEKIATYLNKEDAILYPSCFDANGGVFEALLSQEDAVFSDSLNHASIIDGIRLCKAKRYRFAHNDMDDLEEKLKEEARFRLIVTDGVFSMDGTIANLKAISSLAKKYEALVLVDDCHATGFIGEKGRGTHEYCNVMDQIDLISGTFGKTLGGASGGFIAGDKKIIDTLRQKSRPYLFSNAMAPSMVQGAITAVTLAEEADDLRQKLQENSNYFRKSMEKEGFDLLPGNHPIIPVMLYDAKIASEMAKMLLQEGIYVIAFSYPVVPKEKARIRTQMCALHSKEELDRVVMAFSKVREQLTAGVCK